MLRRPMFAMMALGLAAGALAGPKEDLHAAFAKFLAQTSFKGTTTTAMSGKVLHTTVEFQAPDRYRVVPDGHPPSLIIGDTVYIEVNGRTMKVPMQGSQMIDQYRNPSVLARIEGGLSVEDLGADNVGGSPAQKYRFISAEQQQTASVVWVSKVSGLPIQMQVSERARGRDVETTIDYSDFSDPSIQIRAPQISAPN